MSWLKRLSLPALVAASVLAPLFWAWPEGLGAWRAAGIVSGWTGSGLLLASLLLMLREAWLSRRLGGLERMYAWHHVVGVLAYMVLLAHPLMLAGDATQESAAHAWASLLPRHGGAPIWWGWASLLLLMAGLAASFSTALSYPVWRGLHGLLGVAVLLGAWHLVQLGVTQPVLVVGGLAVLLLGWRVLRADLGLAAQPFVVTTVVPLGLDTVEISLRPLARRLSPQPGQFVLVAFRNGEHYHGCREFHPFTVSAIDADGGFSIGVKALGDCTREMQSMEAGVAARVQGPFGIFMTERAPAPELWIAGGIGIAPFLAQLRRAPLRQPTTLLYFCREASDAPYLAELKHLAETAPQLTVHVLATGTGLPDLAALVPPDRELAGRHAYLCGPPGLVVAATRLLRARGVPESSIHFERFDFR